MINSSHLTHSTHITTALLLAAGTGTRLLPLTLDAPKCLTEVGGIPILRRLVNNLRLQGITRLIVVIGYLGHRIQEFLEHDTSDMQIDYVFNPEYRTTNNIYSLWLARQQIHEPFLLVESDLLFEANMLTNMLQPDRVAISRILPWMNGTTVELGANNRVTAFRLSGVKCDHARQYKTVNLYSFSLKSWRNVEKRLSRYISKRRLGGYYEAVLAEMVADGTLCFDAVFFDSGRWYEIDTTSDLCDAENLFPPIHPTASYSNFVTTLPASRA